MAVLPDAVAFADRRPLLTNAAAAGSSPADALEHRPLSARSVIASALLGTVPPTLPGRLLVALATEFGVAEGTARVALSRMTDRGELVNDQGSYTLAGALLSRQERQLRSQPRPPATPTWNGQWECVVVTGAGRSPAQRSQLRRDLTALNLAERREGVWMRPANLDPNRLAHVRTTIARHVEFWSAVPDHDAGALVEELWDLDAWAATSRQLITSLTSGTEPSLPQGFMLSAAVLRHFVHDPALPVELWPTGWPTRELRDAYVEFDHGYRVRLRAFFKLHHHD